MERRRFREASFGGGIPSPFRGSMLILPSEQGVNPLAIVDHPSGVSGLYKRAKKMKTEDVSISQHSHSA